MTEPVTRPPCLICGAGAHTCGPDHMTHPPVDLEEFHMSDTESTPVTSGAPVEGKEPAELREYEYMVGHVPTTAMLTEEMAERLGATPVGAGGAKARTRNFGGTQRLDNNEAERQATQHAEVDERGVGGEDATAAQTKVRDARNKRAGG